MVTKSYGKKVILDSISIDFNSSCSLIIGENGSGKTTLLKIISGLIVQYTGEYKTQNNVSIMLDAEILFNSKTGLENIDYFLDKEEYNSALKWVTFFKMDNYIKNSVKTYSNGMKKRLMIVIAISKNKEIIILDEPTNSLDIDAIKSLKKCILELKNTKKVIIATHDIALADSGVIDELFMLNNGKIVRRNLQEFNYTIYSIKTVNEIDSKYEAIQNENDIFYKVNSSEKEKFFKHMSQFIPTEIVEIPVFDELYFRGLYDEKDI